MACWRGHRVLRGAFEALEEIRSVLSEKEIDGLCSPSPFRYVDDTIQAG